jgi:amino acid transporter
LLLTLINAVGMTVGKSLQNLLSLAKVLGLLGVVASGLAGRTNSIATERAEPTILGPGFGLAMVFVLYAYGGWNHAVLVTAEVRDPRRNLPRALAGGVSAVTIVYLAVNAAYLVGLGFDEARRSPTPASDLVARAFGPAGGRFLSLLVITSALGAVNGMILTGRALFATLAADDPPLARRLATKPRLIPILSLGILAGCSLLLLFLVGTESGRAMVDFPPRSMGLHTLPWHEFPGGFELLVAASAPVFWFFFLLTALALFVLRNKEPDQVRPFLVPFYPWTPLLFGAASAYMLYSSLEYARWLAIAGVVPVLLAIPLYLLARRAWSAHEP